MSLRFSSLGRGSMIPGPPRAVLPDRFLARPGPL